MIVSELFIVTLVNLMLSALKNVPKGENIFREQNLKAFQMSYLTPSTKMAKFEFWKK
jgi:hypothetical protein